MKTFRERPKIALLTMLDAEGLRIPLTRTLESSTNAGGPVRVLNFQWTVGGATEMEMVLLAQAEEDAAACEKIADAYAWSRFTLQSTNTTGATNFVPIVELTLWQRGDEPQTFLISGSAAPAADAAALQVRQLAPRVAEKALALLNESRSPGPSAARTHVARSFFDLANTFRAVPNRWSRASAQPALRAAE